MHKGLHRVGQIGDEGNHRKVCDGRVDHVARAQRDQTAHRNADLLQDLALRGLPRRLPGVDASAGQSDLSGVVPEVGSAPDERDHPTACLSVEEEDDRGGPRPLSELAPAVDRLEKASQAAEKWVPDLPHRSR